MKFNLKALGKKSDRLNHEAAPAWSIPEQLELYSLVATSSLSDQFYEKTDARLDRLRKLVKKNDPAFVARLAVYAREQMNLRSIPLVLAVELAKVHGGDRLISALVERIVQRTDEITELLSYYTLANRREKAKKLNGLSKQIQKGLGAAFNKFDEYQFAKYDQDTQVKLKDALFLVHPKAKDKSQQAIFDKIVAGTLETPYTWEVELSAVGQENYESAKAKALAIKNKWEELVLSKKLGYMATLRNLRNMLDAAIDRNVLEKACDYLSNAEAVSKSRQLPFRFLSAYRELKTCKSRNTGLVLEALEKAVLQSAANIAGYDADTSVVIAADVSRSMQHPVSAKSKIMYYDIGLMLSMLLRNRCKNVATGMFGDRWQIIQVPSGNILANVQEFYRREGEVGYATNGYLVIQDLLLRHEIVDKIMLFTDVQLWDSKGSGISFPGLWKQYKDIAPNARLYLFDLAGHGTTPLDIQRDDVSLIAGWSDKIFEVLSAVENDGDAIQKISNIVL